MPSPRSTVFAGAACLILAACNQNPAATVAPTAISQAQSCAAAGQWLNQAGMVRTSGTPYAEMAAADYLLLGESHDNLEHHRFQLHTLASIHALRPSLAIGFEMLPRSAQPALDQWVAGELSEAEFLEASGWYSVWGFNPDLYWPLFHYARLHQVPAIAMNVDRSLVRAVGQQGWAAIPAEDRVGLSDPAPASDAYRDWLFEIYSAHGRGTDISPEDEGFARFVEAQLTWDRAMAEALFDFQTAHPDTLMVGILGSGHVRFGYGVPHQLQDLGATKIQTALPAATDECAAVETGIADHLFVVSADPALAFLPPAARLGIRFDQQADGLIVREIVPGSVAEQAGLAQGDIITMAAGQKLSAASNLASIVRQQPPGSILPLWVRRNDAIVEVLARFPGQFDDE